MLTNPAGLGLRLFHTAPTPTRQICVKFTASFITSQSRSITFQVNVRPATKRLSKEPEIATTTPSPSSSFFTPSLCRTQKRNASTTTTTANTASNKSSIADQVLDWNTFFKLRTSRRRYSLASSILSSILTTGGMFVFLTSQPELADEMTKLIPADPYFSMGIATFGATLLGWLIGPIFGNAMWRVFHRARLAEFTIKERAFFERIKKHRVNPTGASTNNPVPDYYGEKIGSVSGYRRWLKDQRAFNRKREGTYNAKI